MKRNILWMTTILFLLVLIFGVRQTQAADAVVGDGTPASCTEAAFLAALQTAIGGGTVTFDCGPAVETITLTSTKFMNLGDVTINGGDQIILNADNIDRHFFVGNGITFELQNITLRDGNSLVGGGAIEASGAHVILESVQLLNNYAGSQGGAIYCYIGADGTLTVNNSFFEHNSSNYGGAIYNDGCVTQITNTTFQNNEATTSGGAIHNAFAATMELENNLFQENISLDGGGVFNDTGSMVTLNAVTFQANSGGYGGGLENSGSITMTNSLLNLNSVTGSGGGIWNMGGTAVVEQTTISNNTAYEGGGINSYGLHVEMMDVNVVGNVATGSHGGGVYHGGGTMDITNATISGNMASDAAANGGGIYQNSDDNLTMYNVTLAENQAGAYGGGFYHYGRYAVLTNVTIGNNLAGVAGDAIYEESPMTPSFPGVVQLVNSVIFGSANNCGGSLFQSFGHNVSQGGCPSLSDTSDQENYGGSLELGGLALNGGLFPMRTFLPQAGSPLIDAADASGCPVTDQRSAARVGTCDIGAVEYGASAFRVYLPLIVR